MKAVFVITFILFISWQSSFASTLDTIKAGSFLINMGVVPQTIANGLKPYGLIYDLLKTYKVPVKWAISSSKAKDGIDFIHNGISYSGGTFIIEYQYRTPGVNTVISNWQSQGVAGNTSVSDFVTTIYRTLHHPPSWTMDKDNGSIAVNFFNNSGIPSSAYGGSSSTAWKDPSQLVSCDDIFVLPHADPTWTNHNYLYYWNLDQKGNIWAGCHSVNVLENTTNPGNTIQLNFLSTSGLVPHGSHANGSLPFQYSYPDDPVMQFMGIADGATNNGSERIYLPKLGGAWRPTTKTVVYDPTHADIPTLSPGAAGVILYGRGFGSDARGWVMYEGGHNLNTGGTIAERVAAQRAFFNFSFFSTSDKNAWFDIQLDNVPETLIPNHLYTFSFTIPDEVNLSNYTVTWSASCPGTFSSTGDPKTVNFTPTTSNSACIITANLVDACNREIFASKGTYLASVLPVVLTSFAGNFIQLDNSVNLNWECSSNDLIKMFMVERSQNGYDFAPLKALFSENNSIKRSYSHKDPQPYYGSNYYRLKIVLNNGSIKYSTIVRTANEKQTSESSISFSKSEPVIVPYFSENNQLIKVGLFDVMGRTVSNMEMKADAGMSYIRFSSFRPEPGLYLLSIQSKGFRRTSMKSIKLLIQ